MEKHTKNEDSRKRAQALNRKETEIETLRILGHFKRKTKCLRVNKFSFVRFLGNFKVPPVE